MKSVAPATVLPTRVLIAGLFVPERAVHRVYRGWKHPDPNGVTIPLHQHELGATTHLRRAIATMLLEQLLPNLKQSERLDVAGHSLGAIGAGALTMLRHRPPRWLHQDFRAAANGLQELEVELARVVMVAGCWDGHGLADWVTWLPGRFPIQALQLAGLQCLKRQSPVLSEIHEQLRPVAVSSRGPRIIALQPMHDGLVSRQSAELRIAGACNLAVKGAPRFSHFQPSAPQIVDQINRCCGYIPAQSVELQLAA